VGHAPLERFAVKTRLNLLLIGLALVLSPARAVTNETRSLILVLGAPGEPEYEKQFDSCADLWERAATNGLLELTVIGRPAGSSADDRTQLLDALSREAAKPEGELWLVFIGHGTFDGHSAKFNLQGPDISADELAAALKPCSRSLVVIQCASASGPFLSALSGPGRVIIAATRSGYEVDATRFGGYMAKAIADPAADLDKDGQVSVLEAFLLASREVEHFYREAGRLSTEHALIDDNGDGLGTPADWFRGVRAVKSAEGGKTVDGVRAHQCALIRSAAERELSAANRARRDEIEQQLTALRLHKGSMKEEEYYNQLESILLALAKLYNANEN
jgi:hypothetical protein